MKRIYWLICLFTCAAFSQTILLLGDSLSSGYRIPYHTQWAKLIEKNTPNARWVNISEAGLTTTGGLTRLLPALKTHKPTIILIALGANDGLLGLNISGIERRLSAMIKFAKHYGKVLLIGVRLPPNYSKKYTQAFIAMYPRLAKKHGLPPPPFLLKEVGEYPQFMQSDRLHPNVSAQPLIMKNVWPTLSSMIIKD